MKHYSGVALDKHQQNKLNKRKRQRVVRFPLFDLAQKEYVRINDMSKHEIGIHENTIGEVGCLWFESGGIPVRVYTLREYAEAHYLSVETVRKMVQSGKLIGIKVGNLWFVQPVSFKTLE